MNINFYFYLFCSRQMFFEQLPTSYLNYDSSGILLKHPTMTLVNELGLWWFPSDNLAKIYSMIDIRQVMSTWEEQDIRLGWVSYYYPHGCEHVHNIVNHTLKEYEINDEELKDSQYYVKSELLMKIVSKKYWGEEIEGFPINHQINVDYDIDEQFCIDELMFTRPKFIINLFDKYCQKWEYNTKKSTTKRLVFDKKSCFPNYVWHIVVRANRMIGFNHFEVVLAKKTNTKLNPRQVVFQLLFPTINITAFSATQKVNAWKAEASFRYHYVERYIKWMEPRLKELI